MPVKPGDGAPVVLGKAYDFALWLLPKVETFPHSHRFTIGERLSMIHCESIYAIGGALATERQQSARFSDRSDVGIGR